jgi:PAS domain S-box-containing protein
MGDGASFDAILQCNLLEVFCEALNAAILVTDKLDCVSFASVRLLHHFPLAETALAPGGRLRDVYAALYDAGCRFGCSGGYKDKKREDWIAERVASAWRERTDAIEPCGPDRWFRVVSRRFPSGLGLTIIQDVTDHKKKETAWRVESQRVQMTEEILDSLPIAIAVKDRDLNFAAVNQQFCKMLGVSAESAIGKNVWDFFEPELAGRLEEADWHLLATGEARENTITVNRPEGGAVHFLHRAKRVGKAGSHFISMSFDELPPDRVLLPGAAKVDILLATSAGGLISGTDTALPSAAASGGDGRPQVACVLPGGDRPDLVAAAAMRGIDLCILHTERELAAFLPAAEGAGLVLDLVAVGAGASPAFCAIATEHGIRHRMLSPDADILDAVIDALERRSRLVSTSALVALEPAKPQTGIDVLAIEDNPVNRLVIEQILESLGLSFVVLADGGEALGHISELKPRCVLADTSMPDIDIAGFMTTLEPLLDAGDRPPVIGLIAADTPDQRRICEAAGLAGVIAKPLSPEAIDLAFRTYVLHDKAAARARSAA